jgi:ParB family chromosome partitioning protein
LPLEEVGAEADAREGRRRLHGAFFIELHRIRPDPTQPRKNLDTATQRELTASITRYGVIQPISVRFLAATKVYQIISGERRFHAAGAAGLAEIPCIVHEPKEREILVRQLVENWQRVDLHPFEIADALVALKETEKCSQRELADMTGKSETEISKLLALTGLSPAAQKLARSGQAGPLTFSHLYSAARLPQGDQASFLESVQVQGLTTRETQQAVRAARPTATGARKPGAPVHRIRIITKRASVLLTFRRKDVTDADILAALDEARASYLPKPDVKIVRVQR